MNNDKFKDVYIENLEEEIKRIRKENKNTIKVKIEYNGNMYNIDTGIKDELTEGKIYWLADDYKNPSSVKFVGYGIYPSVDNKILICCNCFDIKSGNYVQYNPKSLIFTKNKASDKYLEIKGNNYEI